MGQRDVGTEAGINERRDSLVGVNRNWEKER
jgi:hypothetical protein